VGVAGWPVGVVEVGVHGRCTEGVVDGLALHGKLLRPRWGLRMGAF